MRPIPLIASLAVATSLLAADGTSPITQWFPQTLRDTTLPIGQGPRMADGITVVGDVDGLGVPDYVTVGHNLNNTRLVYSANVYSSERGTLLYRWTGNSQTYGTQFGRYVSNAGDVDRDGRPDILIGGQYFYVMSGRTGTPIPGRAWTGPGGVSDAEGGVDWNLDGVPDILTSIGTVSPNPMVLSGQDLAVLHIFETGESVQPTSVAWLGNDRVALGYPGWGLHDQGRVLIGFRNGSVPYPLEGPVDREEFGWDVVARQDGGLMVACKDRNIVSVAPGKVYIYDQALSLEFTLRARPGSVAFGHSFYDENGGRFGGRMSQGDVNGDGRLDFIVLGRDAGTTGNRLYAFSGNGGGLLGTHQEASGRLGAAAFLNPDCTGGTRWFVLGYPYDGGNGRIVLRGNRWYIPCE